MFELGKIYGKVDAAKVFGQGYDGKWIGAVKFANEESVAKIKRDRNAIQMVKFNLRTCRVEDLN